MITYLKELLCKPFLNYPKDPIFRFLLHKSRWELIGFIQDSKKALDTAILDLNPSDDNISVYSADNKSINSDNISDFEIIAFLFSASNRDAPTHLFYIDISLEDLNDIGLKIRKRPSTANLEFKFYSHRHFEIYPINTESRYNLAKKIFDLLEQKYGGEIPKIEKSRFKSLRTNIFIDPRLKEFPKDSLRSKWK